MAKVKKFKYKTNQGLSDYIDIGVDAKNVEFTNGKNLEEINTQINNNIPTKVSDLKNDSNFIDMSVLNLDNFYNKTESNSLLEKKISTEKIGTSNGIAPLNSEGVIDTQYLPSYVDDVLEYNSITNFPITGETGKIYVDTTTNKTYRWGGITYIGISSDIALGETSATAYRGDRGKIAYDHAQAKGNKYINGFYKITTNEEGHVIAATPVAKSDITALGLLDSIPNANTSTTGGLRIRLDGNILYMTNNGTNP